MTKIVKSIQLKCDKCDKIMNIPRLNGGEYDFSELCMHELPKIHKVDYEEIDEKCNSIIETFN